jgi:hypothetical protein
MKNPLWRQRLLAVRESWYLEHSVGARDFGVPRPKHTYNDDTANGLQECIQDFLKYSGYYVNRINTQGQARVEKIQLAGGNVRKNVKWTRGTTNKGTADMDAIIKGKPVKIEVKVGKDRQSKEQRAEEGRVTAAGGYYFIAHDMEQFLQWFDKTFTPET